MNHYDVVIAGCGPTGSYMAWRLAERGIRVLAVDRGSRERQGQDIEVFHLEGHWMARLGLPEPEPDELLGDYYTVTLCSPGSGRRIEVDGVWNRILSLPAFLARLQDRAVAAGATLRFGWDLAEVLRYAGGQPRGVTIRHDGASEEISARILVDATGRSACMRKASPLMEPGPVAPADLFTVYMEYQSHASASGPRGLTLFPECNGWWAPLPSGEVIVGVGAPQGTDPQARHRAFQARHLPSPASIRKTVVGQVPVRLPLRSLVDHGLVVVGDAAVQNKPFNGEGISTAFEAADLATATISEALELGRADAEALWSYNVRWFRGRGAIFATVAAIGKGLLALRSDQYGLLFDAGLQTPRDMRSLFVEHTMAPKTVSDLLHGGGVLLRHPDLMAALAPHATRAVALGALCRGYPRSVRAFPAWRAVVDRVVG